LTINYKPKPRLRVLQETFRVSDYTIKGVKARGVRLASREVKSVRFVKAPLGPDKPEELKAGT